jgi:hypothetical protein
MARKPNTTSPLDSDVERELEKALDFDLGGGAGDIDFSSSMDELEAQISQAADELAKESRPAAAVAKASASQTQGKPAANAEKSSAAKSPEQPKAAAPRKAEPLRPVETAAPASSGSFQPANDDRQQRDYQSMQQVLARRPGRTASGASCSSVSRGSSAGSPSAISCTHRRSGSSARRSS